MLKEPQVKLVMVGNEVTGKLIQILKFFMPPPQKKNQNSGREANDGREVNKQTHLKLLFYFYHFIFKSRSFHIL